MMPQGGTSRKVEIEALTGRFAPGLRAKSGAGSSRSGSRHCEERSDEAIHSGAAAWIASQDIEMNADLRPLRSPEGSLA
jgi:hypothetical protein